MDQLRVESSLRWLLAFALVYGLQRLATDFMSVQGTEGVLRKPLLWLPPLLGIAAGVRFRSFVGAWVIALGSAMNLLVMLANGGLMPLAWEVVDATGAYSELIRPEHIGHALPSSKDVVLLREDVRLFPLSDRYFVEAPGFGKHIYSAGDFVLMAGIALVAVQLPVHLAVRLLMKTRADHSSPPATTAAS